MNQLERDESLKEVDVVGVCPTEYRVTQKGWKSSQFTKSKDLLGCSDRHDYRISLQSTPFRLPDAIQSLPLLKGSHKCTQIVDREGFVQSSTCTESLVFRPFSKHEAGARTEINQKLTYTTTSAASVRLNDPVTSKTTLLFEHKQALVSSDQTLWSARQKLTELCRITVQDILPEVPGLFADLVYLMRGLESKQLLDLADRVQRGNICEDNKRKAQKFFQDALPMVGTSDSIEVMTSMLLSQEITGTQADVWITSLHFVQNPKETMLPHLKNLLLSEAHRMSSLLPITTLVNKFCRSQSRCSSLPEVQNIVDILNDILGSNCQSVEQDLLLMTLRAVGNLGFSDSLASTLEKCVKNTDAAVNTRVTAVQAYRGLSCGVDRGTVMDTFVNTNEDSELRIAAYLAIMQCWDERFLTEIKNALKKEEINQVGSFVWTHLTNLMESSSLHKQALKDILNDEYLEKEFNMDRRKYSRNYETSFFSEKFGLGATGESNIIWSSKSFLPRSAMVNLTVDILGHSVNLFEIGGRIQGLETLIQNYFGADGVFKGGEKQKNNVPSRCVKQEKMDSMKKKFAVDKDELTASLYLRMFGNEIAFHHFNEDELRSLKNKFSGKDILDSFTKGQDISFTQSAMFMDSSVSVPTVAGIALTLSINGTATVELIASSKMDFRKFTMKKMEANFDIRPSGAVQLSCMMSLNAGITRAGLKMVTTLHSSTSASGSMDLTNGQVLSVDLDTPKRNMEIIDVKSEFFLIHNKAEAKQQVAKNQVTKRSCSPESVLKVLGYELCGAVSFINATSDDSAPYFPLTGPVSISATIHKKDAPKGFRLLGKLIHNKATSIAQLSFDTPGSLVERAINIGYFLDTQVRSAEVELSSPWKKVLVKGSYTVEPKTRKLLATVLDDGREYTLQIQLDEDKQKKKTVYTPTLEISRPRDSKLLSKAPEKLSIGGTVTVEDDYSDISGVVSIKSGLEPDPIELKANYVNKEKQNTISGSLTLNQKRVYSATFQVVKDIAKGKLLSGKIEPTILISIPSKRLFLLSGVVDFKEEKLFKTDIKITMDETLKQPIILDTKITKQKKKTNNRFSTDTTLASQFGTFKVKGSFETSSSPNRKDPLFNSKVAVEYNLPVLANKALQKNKLNFNAKVQDKSSNKLKKYEVAINMDSKNYQDASFISNFEVSREESFTKALVALKTGPKAKFTNDKTHELRLELSINHKLDKDSANIGYGLQVLYPVQNIEYEIKGKHEHHLKNKFSFETYNAVVFGKGKSVELRILGNSNSKKDDNLDASGSLELNFPAFEINGRKYNSRMYKLGTSIAQNSDKEYIHTVNLQVNDDKHTLVTKFKRQKHSQFDFYSQLHVTRDPPLKLTLIASRDTENIKGSAEFFMNGDVYYGALNSGIIGDKYQSLSWDFVWPERRIKGSLEAGQKQEPNTMMKFEIFWDADKDITKKITADLNYSFDNGKRAQKTDFSITITTPFENHKIYSYKRLAELAVRELKDEFKIIWQKAENEWSYSFWLFLPPSLEKFEMKSRIITPLDSLRKFGFDINHKFDGSRYLSSTVKGAYNDDEMTVSVLIANTGDKVRNNLDSSFTIISTLPKYRNVVLKVRHNDDGRVYSTELLYERNSEQYKATFYTTYFRLHYHLHVDSKLELTIPTEKPIVFTWVHANTLTNLNSTVTLNWKPEYDTKLDVGVKFNKAEKDYALDVAISGPWKEFKDFEIQYRHNMMMDILGSYYMRINKDPKLTVRSTYKYTSSDLKWDYDYSNGNYKGALTARFEHYPYTVLFEQTLAGVDDNRWEERKIVFDGSVDKTYSDGWSANAKLVTPWNEVRNVDIRGNLQKTSQSQWKFDSVVMLGVRKQITVDFTVDTAEWSEMNALIKTPYKEMNSLSFGFSKETVDKLYSSGAYIEILPLFKKVIVEQSVSFEPDFTSRYYIDLPETDIKFIEINVYHAEQRRGYNTVVKVNYYPEKELSLNFNGKFNKNKFPENTKVLLDLVTPFDVVPAVSITGELDKNQGKWVGLFEITSETKGFEHLKITMVHAATNSSCYNDFQVESSLAETIDIGMHFDWGDMAAVNITLNAPSVSRAMIGFKQNSKSWTDFQHKVFAEIVGYNLDMDVGLKHDEDVTKVWLLYAYPGADHSYLKTSIHRIGNSANDFDVGGFLQVGKDSKPYNISMQYAMLDTKVAIGTTLETPFTKSLSYYVKNEKKEDDEYVTVLYGKYDTGYLVDSSSAQKISDKAVEFSTRNEYLFDGKGHKSGTKVSASWSEHEQEAEVEAYYNDHWARTQVIRKAEIPKESERTEKFDILLFTPYTDYKDIGMHVTLNIENSKYHGTCSFEYMDEHEALLTYGLTIPNDNEANLEAALLIPIENYQRNTLNYHHTTDKNQFIADAEIITGKGEHLTGKIEFKNNEDYIITLTGPVEQFKSLVLSGKYNEKQKKVNGKAQLILALNSMPAVLEYDIAINNHPVTMNFKLKSPYENVQNANLVIEHEGQEWKNFRNKAILTSERIGEIKSETTWKFGSVTNMEGKTVLTSSLKNMENLKFDFSTSDSSGSQVSYVKVGWREDKEIALNNSWNLKKAGENTKFTTSLGMSTPFNEVKTTNIKLSHSHTDQMFSEGVALSHNGQTYLDADLSYQYSGKNEAIVEIRNPRPMTLVVTGSATKELLDGTINFKWDKRSPEAQIEIITSLADRSEFSNIDKEFKFKAIHPVRIMGIDCSYKKANNEIISSGLITWDEQNGNTFSYDLAWINRTSVYSQMHEGHVKLGVPQRSVKVQGSYSDSGSSITTSSAVWWDADRDEKKKVTMSTNVETRENLKRVGLNINLPYINKQLNLDGTTRENYGSTISDSRAEISYSSDPRKLIVVTSKISNSEISSPTNYNYTIDIGFEHPVTDIDLKLSSHLAHVDSVCSAGSQLVFLTVNKEKKNLAFWTKLDRAQKNLQIKVVTPLKTVGVEGQMNSLPNQHHMFLKSYEDNKQALKLDVIVDSRRRNLDIEFNYDQDDPSKLVKFTGHFVNDSALRIDMITQDGRQTSSESMIAVRLNTSNILHTRILWKPKLLHEMQTFVGTKVTAFSYTANEAFSNAVDSVGSEVKAKYQLISSELQSEISHVFKLMDKEMESLSVQMDTLKTEFRRFYQRNDLFIRDMGEQMKSAFDELTEQIQGLVRSYGSYRAAITKATNDWLAILRAYPIAQKYALAIEQLTAGLKNLRQVLEEALDDVATELNQFSAVSYRQYLEISRAIDRKLSSYTRSLQELPMYRKMMEQKSRMEQLGVKTWPEWTQLYNTLYLKGQEMLQDQYHDIMSRPEFQHMHAVASEIHQQITHWNMEQTMDAGVKRIIDLSKNLILMELMKLRSYLVDFEKSRVIVFDPERGELQCEIHLPIPLKSLTEAPEIKVDKYFNSMQKWVQINVPSFNYSIWDTYYDYVPSLELPPFEASAYLIGGQHYITFDETHFDFSSTCSHVLTRELISDNFSVVVNYEYRSQGDGVKSLCFSIENSLTFEIFTNYKLEVNNRETEMPFISDRVKIVREGDFIHVEYAGGLEALCNPQLQLYKITVKDWHHGHVAGLLGTYDKEASNDKLTSQMTQDFEVNRRSCASKNVALSPDPALDLDNMCTQIFDDSSSKFRPCFKQVDPADFVRMCQIYMKKMTDNEAIHLVTEQYRYVCQGHGVYIGPLKDYIPCNGENSFIVEGSDPIYQSADVLFVVEDSVCNQWAASSLSSVVSEINNALTNEGFRDNKFGLQGYGGVVSKDVSVRTINGHHFGEASLFLKAAETLRLADNTDPGDLASAVRSAMAYPFRPGVAK
ncbi:unnamed protein product, partial [Candidula unifasciata]